MAQPSTFTLSPSIPITFVFQEPPTVHAEDQTEFDLDQLDYDDSLDAFAKRWEEELKAAYKKKVFKTVLQGEVYTRPIGKEKK